MRISEYVSFDAVGLVKLVTEGEVTPAELEAAAREAAQAVNPQINAIVETWPADDEPGIAAPLAGVPFLIKDIGVRISTTHQYSCTTGTVARFGRTAISGWDVSHAKCRCRRASESRVMRISDALQDARAWGSGRQEDTCNVSITCGVSGPRPKT